ncbi:MULTISPECIES: hypothetical protein [Streptomyces]|uniref:hypothetical protein n=1 Tax=Streptomyces TaxID=1883 RepID=UPI001EFDE99D|nr:MULTISPECIES: hypothetical protein [Streptomyces]MCR8944330.1 hypothetical protein [Streptomyces sp. OUCMDZ-4982]MDI7788302.1 hypothetical protein [Streptomyces cavourensis]
MAATAPPRPDGTAVPRIPARAPRRIPLPVTVSAWAVPVMVIGQFALIAGVPVLIALTGTLRRVPDRAARRAAALVAAAFAAPLTVWLTRDDGAPSLSKDMHPGFLALIVAASAVFLVTLHRARRTAA